MGHFLKKLSAIFKKKNLKTSNWCVAIFIYLGLSFSVQAESIREIVTMFYEWNIYAPSVLKEDGIYKIWYGGWHTKDDSQDRMFYRTSIDNVTWSEPSVILTPRQIGPEAVHVNDPSVTTYVVDGKKQYAMFYTVCVAPCEQGDNQLWSSFSTDGLRWKQHQVLLAHSDLGPAEPSAVVDPEPDGTFWKVYYVDRYDDHHVKMIRVDKNRKILSKQIVYTHHSAISGAEVKKIDGNWHLFFNAWFKSHVDIYSAVSKINTSWPTRYKIIIQNKGKFSCGALTPGVLPLEGPYYDLYFGRAAGADNEVCHVDRQGSIDRIRYSLQ